MEERHPVDLRCSVVLFRKSSVLLCQRQDLDNVWVLPGGTPRRSEGVAAAAVREVAEETGLKVAAERVIYVLETKSWEEGRHLIEIVFLGTDESVGIEPTQLEDRLVPHFVPMDELERLELRPSIAGYIKGFPRERSADMDWQLATAPWLGNLWRGDLSDATA